MKRDFKMNNKNLFFITIFLCSISFSRADITSFANNAIVELDSPGTSRSNERTILYGGGMTIKAPISSYYPLNIQPPSVKAGCSGIDMTFGSVSFLDGDQMVAFAQNILSAAPGVAFDLALKTLCPSCSDTLKSLQTMANQINAMGMNSCQAAKALSASLKDSTSILAEQKTQTELPDSDSWLKRINENQLKNANDFLSNFNNKVNNGCTGSGCKPIKFFTQTEIDSVLQYMMSDAPSYYRDFESVFRALMGDVIITSRPNGEILGKVTWKSSIDALEAGEVAQGSNAERLFKRLIGEDVEASVLLADGATAGAAFSPGTLSNDFERKIQMIIDNFANRRAHSQELLDFVGMFRAPVYRLFNVYSSMPEGWKILEDSKKELAKMLAMEFVYHYILEISMMATNYRTQYESAKSSLVDLPFKDALNSVSWVETMSKNSRIAANIAYKIYIEKYDLYSKKATQTAEMVKKINELKQFAISRTSPDLYENYLYSKTISGGR